MLKYSVLMTVWAKDNPEYFELALDSMFQQTYKPDEIIIVKDGYIGNILQEIIDKRVIIPPPTTPHNIIPIVQIQLPENKGLGTALNEGMKVVKNELVARMDSDDYSLPERCELQIKEFEKNPALDIVGCPVIEFIGTIDNIVGKRNVPLTNEEIYKFAKKRDPFNHPTVMYRKSAVKKAGFYSNYRKNQDTDLWIKMLLNRSLCMNISKPVFRFRFDEETYKKRKSWLNTKILIEIRYKAWRRGFNTFREFLMITIAQLCVCALPISFQKFLYKKILRR